LITGIQHFLISEAKAELDLGELGLVIKRSQTFDPCLLCRFDGLYKFCRPGMFQTLRIKRSDYYILTCRLGLGNYLVRQLRLGFLAELIKILKEIEKQKAKSS